jgi:pilus assembly protein CpaF
MSIYYVKKENEAYVTQRATEIVEQLRAEFGTPSDSGDDTPEVVTSKSRRIHALVPDDLAPDDVDGCSNRLEILWRAHTALLSPLDALLQFDCDIAAHGTGRILARLHGMWWQDTDLRFEDNNEFVRHINRLLQPLGKQLDDTHPEVTAFLPDGTRIEALLPPISQDFPMLVVSRAKTRHLPFWTLEGLSDNPPDNERKRLTPMMSEAMAFVLAGCVQGRVNIIVSGGASSGKTTLMRALCQKLNTAKFELGKNSIVAVIEAARELLVPLAHAIRLCPQADPSIPGPNRRQLLNKTMNLMAERIVLDECIGPEAYDLFRIMGSRLKGCMTAVTAETPRDCLVNLEALILEGHPALPLQTVRHLIAQAHPLIVQTRKLEDGTCRVTEITELRGINDGSWHSNHDKASLNLQDLRENEYILGTLFHLERDGRDPRGFFRVSFVPSGNAPDFLEQLEQEAVPFKLEWIKPKDKAAVK